MFFMVIIYVFIETNIWGQQAIKWIVRYFIIFLANLTAERLNDLMQWNPTPWFDLQLLYEQTNILMLRNAWVTQQFGVLQLIIWILCGG